MFFFFKFGEGVVAGILVESCDKDKGDGLRWDLYGFIHESASNMVKLISTFYLLQG